MLSLEPSSGCHVSLREEFAILARGDTHAGDVGKPEVIDRLGGVAATFVVRGNIDNGGWAARLPPTQTVEVGALRVFVLHDIAQLDLDPTAAGFAAVVFGHSHRPSIETRDGVLFLNPGSAGPRRFTLPITVVRVRVAGQRMASRALTARLSKASSNSLGSTFTAQLPSGTTTSVVTSPRSDRFSISLSSGSRCARSITDGLSIWRRENASNWRVRLSPRLVALVIMYWYGWTVLTLLVGTVLGLIGTLLPESVVKRIPLALVWLLPILALIPLAYSLMPFWTK